MRTPAALDLPAVLVRNRELLWSFVWRDLKSRYQGSLLGRLWPVLNPLILFIVYYFVFAVILGMRLQERGQVVSDSSLVGLYLISGLIPWTAFADSLVRCTGVVLENGNLVKKIAFPSQLLPIYAVCVNTIYFLLAMAIFIVLRLTVFWDTGARPGLPPSWPLLFLAIPLQVIFTTGIGLFLGALNIFVRDTAQVIQLILQLWFFTTPIVYPVQLLEENLPEWAFLLQFNPMYHLMEMYRAALVIDFGRTPWDSTAIFAVVAFVVLIPGYAFFVRTKGRFADEL